MPRVSLIFLVVYEDQHHHKTQHSERTGCKGATGAWGKKLREAQATQEPARPRPHTHPLPRGVLREHPPTHPRPASPAEGLRRPGCPPLPEAVSGAAPPPTCSETARKRQEASLAVILRYSPRLPRYSSMATSPKDFCPKYFFQPFCIFHGRRLKRQRQKRERGGGSARGAARRVAAGHAAAANEGPHPTRPPAPGAMTRPPASPFPPAPGAAAHGAHPTARFRLAPVPPQLGPVPFSVQPSPEAAASGALPASPQELRPAAAILRCPRRAPSTCPALPLNDCGGCPSACGGGRFPPAPGRSRRGRARRTAVSPPTPPPADGVSSRTCLGKRRESALS